MKAYIFGLMFLFGYSAKAVLNYNCDVYEHVYIKAQCEDVNHTFIDCMKVERRGPILRMINDNVDGVNLSARSETTIANVVLTNKNNSSSETRMVLAFPSNNVASRFHSNSFLINDNLGLDLLTAEPIEVGRIQRLSMLCGLQNKK